MYSMRLQVYMEDSLTTFIYPRISDEEIQEKLKEYNKYKIEAVRIVRV